MIWNIMDLELLLMKNSLVDGQKEQGTESVYIHCDLQPSYWIMLLLFVMWVELYICLGAGHLLFWTFTFVKKKNCEQTNWSS